LFDSVLNGYPVGSLLLWEKQGPAEEVTLGPLRIDAPATTAYYVVDGQQRITALAAALTKGGETDQRFAVGFDLESNKFTARSSRDSGTWIPAHVLYDLTTLLAWFRDRPELADRFDAAASVSKSLRDLRLPAYVVRQDDEEVLRSIFDRMNNGGKKLTRGEVFDALHRSSGSANEVTLRWIADQIEARTGFGSFDEGTVMQFVLARRGPDVMREIRNEFAQEARGRDDFAAEEPRTDAYRLAADAAVRAINFVQGVAGVPHSALLPYQYVLVTLTRFFAHHESPSPRHERLLRRFFWRAAIAGPRLGRGNTTGVSRMLNRAIVPGDEVASIAGLMSAVTASRLEYPSVDPFRTNSAASKALLCALWQHGPRSIIDGRKVEVEELRLALQGEQTALRVVVPLLPGRRAGDHDKSAGDRILLVPEEDRETDLLVALQDVSEVVLASHLLEPEDLRQLIGGDGVRLLHARAQRLEGLQQTFLDQMCEWDQEDSVDLNLLMARTLDAST
jgi:hypothetical protein